MKIFSRDNPARPLIIVCLGYTIIGYALFFVACLLPTPSWGPSLMAWCAPVIKSIHTAAQVGLLKGHDPFPIQAVILYSALGAIPITTYFVWFCLLNSNNRWKWFKGLIDKAKEEKCLRLGLFLRGMFMLTLPLYFTYSHFFTRRVSVDSWTTIKGNSLTLLAVFLNLSTSFIPTIGILGGIAYLFLTFSKQLNQLK